MQIWLHGVRFDQEIEFGVFMMGKRLRIAYFFYIGFYYYRCTSATFRKESRNFSPRASNLPFRYPTWWSRTLILQFGNIWCLDDGMFQFNKIWSLDDGIFRTFSKIPREKKWMANVIKGLLKCTNQNRPRIKATSSAFQSMSYWTTKEENQIANITSCPPTTYLFM